MMGRVRGTNPFETLALAERVQTELVGDLGGVHGVGKILTALDVVIGGGERGVLTCLLAKTRRRASRSSSSLNMRCTWGQRPSLQSALTFLSRLGDTFPVIRVDDEDDALRVLEVYRD
jgi:hypothetical protein